MISTDFYATILDLAGAKRRPKQHVDSVSLLPALKGEALQRDAIYWHYPHYHGSTWTPGAAMRAGNWKLIEFYEYDTVELYNLADDLSEQEDLAQRLPEKRDELLGMLHKWQKEVGAKMPAKQ